MFQMPPVQVTHTDLFLALNIATHKTHLTIQDTLVQLGLSNTEILTINTEMFVVNGDNIENSL